MNEEIFNPISESYKSEDGADLVQHVLQLKKFIS